MITVGMNYEVLPGKGSAFEKKFALVVEALASLPGHVTTRLYRDVANERSFLVVSEWDSRGAFDAFVGSDAFRKTTEWGAAGILASRPTHRVYGDDPPVAGGCPVPHAEA
jgi:heme-degrading monooxygenase HmoA